MARSIPIPDRSVDTIVAIFFNGYLPVHMCPQYILLVMEQNSKITLWTSSYNNSELIGFSQHPTIHRAMASSKSSINT